MSQAILLDLNAIISSGKRLSNLVNDILDYSRLKQGDLEIHPKAVDLYAVVSLVIGLSNPLIGRKSLQILNKVSTRLPPVHADENRLQQILHNLIGNAVKFTEKGSVEVSAEAKGKRMEVIVSDTGVGIKHDQLERIFNTFEQIDGSITRKHQGMGLGLAITKKLVEAHQGTIRVESTQGVGSRFIVSMPLAENTGQPHVPPQTESSLMPIAQIHHAPSSIENQDADGAFAEGQAASILVVDDDPINLQVVESQLKDQHYRVQLAADGKEALSLIDQSGKPDILLLDIMMPQMSGFELCRILREKYPAYELPVIFLTAKNQVADLVKGFSIGANDYLTKPFSRDELLARVRNQLQLLQTGRKLSSLRQISRDLEKMKDAEQMILSVFEEINQTLYVSESIIWSDGHPQHLYQRNNNRTALNPESRIEAFNGNLFEEGEEMTVIESLESHHPAFELCHSLSRESVRGSHWILIRMTGFETFLICLYRRPEEGMFSATDREYLKSILREIDLKRRAMQTVAIDIRLNRSLIEIAEQLESILYIQGGKSSPYCDIVMESNPVAPFSLRISLQHIQTFFPETSLLRIHNSYLINPRKVKVKPTPIRKRGKRDFEIVLNSSNGTEIPLPISRNYMAAIKQNHPNWFE